MDSGNHTCCGLLEKLREQYPGTFYRPIQYDDDMQLKVLGWCLKLYKVTATQKVTHKGQSTLILNFCPLCGEQLNLDYGKRGGANNDE